MKAAKLIYSRRVLFILGVMLVAANMRAPITSVGPVIPEIQDAFGLSNALVGMITAIPLLAFALLSPIAPVLADRFHIKNVIWAALFFILIGLFLRVGNWWILLYTGTVFIGAGIAMCNVLMTPLIKQEFPAHIGLLTGIYSVAMNLAASFASGLSISIGLWTGYGWKGSLGFWMIFAGLGLLFWSLQIKGIKRVEHQATYLPKSRFMDMMRLPKAWFITIFMGVQSLLFYCIVAWLPVVLQEWGMTAEKSGWTLSFVQFSQLPVVFVAPIVIARLKNHTVLLWFIGISLFLSLTLVLVGKTVWIIPAMILYGIGTGLAFSLVLMWFVLRTQSTSDAARLSGMAQSFGYAIAAIAPPLFGVLHDWSGAWTLPFAFLFVMVVLLLLFGQKVARPGYIDQ